ncbi:MAG: alpha/beta hydrolase [Clostridiales bacterium]|nr:alpha/beta hydrolase [Clostridiales bacterium]
MTKEKILWLSCGSSVGAIALFIIILTIISRKVYHRSLMATFIVLFFRLTVHHKSDSEVIADANYLPLKNDCPYVIPRSVRTRKQQKYVFEGMTVFGVNMNNNTDRVVVYLHGGGYVRQPRLYHWKYINKLAAKVGNVVVPIYPKAPRHHPKEVVDILTKMYIELCKMFDKVVLMGDSSGGGLALALCQHWDKLGFQQPRKTILFSPWTDLTLSNPEIDRYQKLDPLICASSERIWAKLWAGDIDLRNALISPMFGDMSKLGKILLFTGDREILYPDLVKLNDIMIEQGADVRFTVGHGMNHVYQVYPIPEARKALNEIVEEIKQV